MENLIIYIVMLPCSALFTAIGIYAWNRKKPMWFWSGKPVEENEVTDVVSYNHANGIIWITHSLVLLAASIIEFWSSEIALMLIIGSLIIEIPLLVLTYNKIYVKYKA